MARPNQTAFKVTPSFQSPSEGGLSIWSSEPKQHDPSIYECGTPRGNRLLTTFYAFRNDAPPHESFCNTLEEEDIFDPNNPEYWQHITIEQALENFREDWEETQEEIEEYTLGDYRFDYPVSEEYAEDVNAGLVIDDGLTCSRPPEEGNSEPPSADEAPDDEPPPAENTEEQENSPLDLGSVAPAEFEGVGTISGAFAQAAALPTEQEPSPTAPEISGPKTAQISGPKTAQNDPMFALASGP